MSSNHIIQNSQSKEKYYFAMPLRNLCRDSLHRVDSTFCSGSLRIVQPLAPGRDLGKGRFSKEWNCETIRPSAALIKLHPFMFTSHLSIKHFWVYISSPFKCSTSVDRDVSLTSVLLRISTICEIKSFLKPNMYVAIETGKET